MNAINATLPAVRCVVRRLVECGISPKEVMANDKAVVGIICDLCDGYVLVVVKGDHGARTFKPTRPWREVLERIYAYD